MWELGAVSWSNLNWYQQQARSPLESRGDCSALTPYSSTQFVSSKTNQRIQASQPALMLSFRLARSFLRLLARFFLFLSTLTMVHSSSSYNTLKLALVLARVFLCIFCGFLATSVLSHGTNRRPVKKLTSINFVYLLGGARVAPIFCKLKANPLRVQ